MLWLYLEKKTNLFESQKGTLLHIAPETCLMEKFTDRFGEGGDYLTADISSGDAMIKMDITRIQYPHESFDYILCSHVLEHVLDDRKAMRELYRVLKHDGWAILMVPIADSLTTYEDPSIVDPAERELAFGQYDHVRLYGHDFIDRIAEAGFKVEKTGVSDLATGAEALKMGLKKSDHIFFCTK